MSAAMCLERGTAPLAPGAKVKVVLCEWDKSDPMYGPHVASFEGMAGIVKQLTRRGRVVVSFPNLPHEPAENGHGSVEVWRTFAQASLVAEGAVQRVEVQRNNSLPQPVEIPTVTYDDLSALRAEVGIAAAEVVAGLKREGSHEVAEALRNVANWSEVSLRREWSHVAGTLLSDADHGNADLSEERRDAFEMCNALLFASYVVAWGERWHQEGVLSSNSGDVDNRKYFYGMFLAAKEKCAVAIMKARRLPREYIARRDAPFVY